MKFLRIFFFISLLSSTPIFSDSIHTCTKDDFDTLFESNYLEIYNYIYNLSYETVYKSFYSIVFKETLTLLQDPMNKEIQIDDLSKEEVKAFYYQAFQQAINNHLEKAMDTISIFSGGSKYLPEIASEEVFHDIILDAIKQIILEAKHAD